MRIIRRLSRLSASIKICHRCGKAYNGDDYASCPNC